MTEKVRCFIALELSREAINYIKELQDLIKKKNLFHGKFTEDENLHLTVKFLGEISEERVKEVQEKLREIKLSSFEAGLGEVGIFSEKFLRIVWIKMLGKEVWDLQKQIDDKMVGVGFEPEHRFMGHITMARIKEITKKAEFLRYLKGIKTKKITFPVKEFVLKKSVLTPEGPNYEDVERYRLA